MKSSNETTHQAVDYKKATTAEKMLIDAAVEKEFSKLREYHVYDSITMQQLVALHQNAEVIETKAVITLKLTPDGTRAYKCRIVGRGDQDGREGVESSTGSCPPEHIRLVLQAAISCPRPLRDVLCSVDVENAYLQAQLESHVPIAVKPPPQHPDRAANKVWLLKKGLYGLKDAGRLFENHVVQVLTKHGWTASPLTGVFWKLKPNPALLLRKGSGTEGKAEPKMVAIGLIAQYVDDLIVVSFYGKARDMVKEISKDLVCKPPEDDIGRFVGNDYEIGTDNDGNMTWIWCEQKKYLTSLKPTDGKHRKAPIGPLPANVQGEEDHSLQLNPKQAFEYRHLLGALAYVVYCSRPDLAFPIGWLARWNQQPTARADRLLNGVLAYAQQTSQRGIKLGRAPFSQKIYLDMFVDAAGGSDVNPHPQTGWVLNVNGRVIMWKSKKQSRVARSINRGELLAFEDALDMLGYLLTYFRSLWREVIATVHTDSQGVLSMLISRNPQPQEKALRATIVAVGGKVCVVPAIAARHNLEDHRIHACHIPTQFNISDPLTKGMEPELLGELMEFTAIPFTTVDKTEIDQAAKAKVREEKDRLKNSQIITNYRRSPHFADGKDQAQEGDDHPAEPPSPTTTATGESVARDIGSSAPSPAQSPSRATRPKRAGPVHRNYAAANTHGLES